MERSCSTSQGQGSYLDLAAIYISGKIIVPAAVGVKSAHIQYVGDGNPSHIVTIPFMPKTMMVQTAGGTFRGSTWYISSDGIENIADNGDDSQFQNSDAAFPSDTEMDVGVLQTMTNFGYVNGNGLTYDAILVG